MPKKTPELPPFKKGKVHDKIPLPPQGYVPLKVKNKKVNSESTMMECPYCKNANGYGSHPCYFTDPLVQAEFDKAGSGYEPFCKMVKDSYGNEDMLKSQWSRMDGWICMDCGGIILHDWDMGEVKGRYYRGNHYWNPTQEVKKVAKTKTLTIQGREKQEREVRKKAGVNEDEENLCQDCVGDQEGLCYTEECPYKDSDASVEPSTSPVEAVMQQKSLLAFM